MKTILTLILLALCASAQARIGETVAECVQRYGKPVAVDEPGTTFTFFYTDLRLKITFQDGKCAAIEYERRIKSIFGGFTYEGLNQTERDLLLEANAGGHKWEANGLFEKYNLATDDGALFAADGMLVTFRIVAKKIKLQEEAKAKNDEETRLAAKKAEAEKKLKGL